MERNDADILRAHVADLLGERDTTRILSETAEFLPGDGRAEAAGSQDLLRKLISGAPLTPDEQFGVEAIILPDLRPSPLIRDGDFTLTHPLWVHLNDQPTHDRLRARLASIGRIELPNHPTLPYGGTGFVVGDGLLMTNRHVAAIFASGLGTDGLIFDASMGTGVDFLREADSDASAFLSVAGVVMIHPYWDMALLRVEGLGPDRTPLRLSLSDPDAIAGREMVVVGYPAFDPRNDAAVQNTVFGGVYNVKRLQPGLMRARRRVVSFGHEVDALTHDSSTLGGNSGSAVIDVATGEVVGLHFGGRYRDANFAVPAGDLARDGRVIDAGVSFAGAPVRGGGAGDAAWAALGARTAAPEAGATVAAAVSGRVSVEIPLRITVELGEARTTPAPASGAAPAAPAAEGAAPPVLDQDYAARPGYDPDFLGAPVPFPRPADPSLVAVTADGGWEARYHHFSIAMHRARRLALITAANVDASPARKRPGELPAAAYTRKGLAGRDRDTWFADPRLPALAQLPDRFYVKDRGSFDRGHIVRREDVAWGDSYDEMRRANIDSFHVTNCSPQVAGFNQADGAVNWGELENEVMRQAGAERLSVFAGPVLAPDDQVFAGLDDDGAIRARIPSRFWKVIASGAGGAIRAYGFVLEQDLSAVQWEYVVNPVWRPFMAPLGDIERLAGVVFPGILRAGDQAATPLGAEIARWLAPSPPPATPPAPHAPAADVDALLADLAPIFEGWRAQQAHKGGGEPGARFVLNFEAAPPGDAALAAMLEARLGLTLTVGPLFGADPEFDRYRLVEIPDVSRIDRPDMFDLARAIRALTDAGTVDPDLGSDFYDWDRETPDAAAPESADFAIWCWAPDREKPLDPDWAIKATHVPEAWAFSAASGRPAKGEGIVVFQPDTGVVDHEELPPGLLADPRGANFVEPGQPPRDLLLEGNPGHGTATGSVVASPEAGAMRGSAPRATLVPVRALTSVVVFDQSRVAQAIDHARRNGAHVISMSLGGVFSSALHAALRRAVKANIIVIAAAGNCVGIVVWPARYAEAIAVGGINVKLDPWRGSSSGSAVAISGPAEFVLRADARDATAPTTAVSGGQGTSFATAHLAGVAALWLAHHGRDALIAGLAPGRTLQAAFRAALAGSASRPPGFDSGNFGAGIVDANALVRLDPAAALAGGAEAVAEAPEAVDDGLDSALAEVFGVGAVEAAGPAMEDGQNRIELACAALERARAARGRRATREALPPLGLSGGLRAALAPGALKAMGAGDAR